MYKIISNHHWRLLKYYHDFTEEEKEEIDSDYDWMDQEERETSDWIVYRDRVYNIADFMSIHNRVYNPVIQDWQQGWDGYLSDSFFSAILIKLSDCGDMYKIGLMLS